jgi:hypothetical protein
MPSSVLTQLQSLIQPRFVVTAFFPMLAFVTLNALMLSWLNAPFRAFSVDTFLKASTVKSTFVMAVAMIGTAMLAYIFSALLPAFQLILEGRWPAWLISIFVPVQVRQLQALQQQRVENDRLRGGLENSPPVGDWAASKNILLGRVIRPSLNNPGGYVFIATQAGTTGATAPAFPQSGGAQVPDGQVTWENAGTASDIDLPKGGWTFRLRVARKHGTQSQTGRNNFSLKSAAAREIARLERLRQHNRAIRYSDLENAVSLMQAELAQNDADHAANPALENTRTKLKELIDYATDHAYSEELRLTNKLRFNFGSQRPAPTRMGNIANTVQSYAERRYKLNFEVFWARMQRAIQRDKDFSPVLQQSKMQLDFLISCCVLTAIWSALWMTISLSLSAGRLAFVLSSVVAPAIAYSWYRAGVAQYQTFADVLRTSIDLFRFNLLTDLHIALPDDLPEEQALWDTLHRIHSYYEPQPLHYQHPKST